MMKATLIGTTGYQATATLQAIPAKKVQILDKQLHTLFACTGTDLTSHETENTIFLISGISRLWVIEHFALCPLCLTVYELDWAKIEILEK